MKTVLCWLFFLGTVLAAEKPKTVPLPGLTVVTGKNGKHLEVPGKVANTNGILEFVACETEGRDYESLLTLDTKPSVLQAALILIGCPTGTTARVRLEIRWGTNQTATVESWLLDRKTQRSPATLQWMFNGSYFANNPVTGQQVFLADEERAHIALWWQPSIPINLAGDFGNPYRADAHGFEINPATIPPIGTPVTLILRP